MELLVMIVVFVLVLAALGKAGQQARIKKAFTWNPPNIKGHTRFATDKDLKGKLL